MNGKWLLSVGLPLMLLTTVLAAAPILYYDIQANPTGQDPNVVVLGPHNVQLKLTAVANQTKIRTTLYAWVMDPAGIISKGGFEVGFGRGAYGIKSSTGGLLVAQALPSTTNIDSYCNYRNTPGYLPGKLVDMDVDTDLDLGSFCRIPNKDANYDANFADFTQPFFSSTLYKFWNSQDGDVGDTVKGPDGNLYVGFKIGTELMTVKSLDPAGTQVSMFPFFYASASMRVHGVTNSLIHDPNWTPQRFGGLGRDGNNYDDGDPLTGTYMLPEDPNFYFPLYYTLSQPYDSNYIALPPNDPNVMGMYVSDPAQFLVQGDTPLNITLIPEPTVVCLTIVGAVAFLSRRRRKA